MKISTYRQRLRDAFYKRLDKKTGWGRLEIKKEFEEVGEEVLMEMLDEEEGYEDSRPRP